MKQIAALMASKSQSFAPSALPTWHYALFLATIASMSSLMAFITIIAPGSLRIESSKTSSPCTVPTVSLNTSDIAITAMLPDGNLTVVAFQPRLLKLAGRVLMAGAPLPPQNPCSDSCDYKITFDAPVANCTPVDAGFNFTSWLPPPANSNARILVWNTLEGADGSHLIVASRNLANNSQSAVNCTTYKATYTVAVSHSNTTSSTARILHTVQYQETHIANTTTGMADAQFDALTMAFGNLLIGRVNADPLLSNSLYYGDNWLVGLSPAFSGTSESSWSPTLDLGTEISSFMQNLSVSLLTDEFSGDGQNPTTALVNTTCWYQDFTYNYNRAQLLAIYSAAIGVTAVCVVIGVRAIQLNGVEESFRFSRVIGAVLNPSLFLDRRVLTESSHLTADGSPDGQLRFVHATDESDEVPDNVLDRLIS